MGSDLGALGRTRRRAAILAGTCEWLAVSLTGWLALFALDNRLRLPAALRLPLAVLGLFLTGLGLVRRVGRPAWRRANPERTAVALEREHQVPDNLLINACLLEADALSPPERRFAGRTQAEARARLTQIPPAALWNAPRLKRWGLAATLPLLAWIVYAAWMPDQSVNALRRYAWPLRDVPPVGRVALAVVPARHTIVLENGDLTVSAVVRPRDPRRPFDGAPILAWRDGASAIRPGHLPADAVPMRAVPEQPDTFRYTFRGIRRPFAFRVFAADTYSPGVRVDVRPLPAVAAALFRVTPPAYTGRQPVELPGPPASVACYAGSTLEARLTLDQEVTSLVWNAGRFSRPFVRDGGTWRAAAPIQAPDAYTVEFAAPFVSNRMTIAAGDIAIEPDHTPQVQIESDLHNLLLDPGEQVHLRISASDDLGLRQLQVVVRPADRDDQDVALQTWGYLGPPGPGQARETYRLTADPRRFRPGDAYLLRAVGADFSPEGRTGESRAIMLRVKAWTDLAVPASHPFAPAFEQLRKTVAEQKRANELSEGLRTHAEDAAARQTVAAHGAAMSGQQSRAQSAGAAALERFRAIPECEPRFADRLATLVEQEMSVVLRDIGRIGDSGRDAMLRALAPVAERQDYLLHSLITLLGDLARAAENAAPKRGEGRPEADTPPAATREEAADRLHEDLEDFVKAQERIVQATRALVDETPDDLTQEEEKILGDLAREEAEWARFLKEALTDFSKLPLQDFADGSIAEEFNEVLHEVATAAQSLYDRNIEIAVPQEQSGLEAAEALLHNLERWLPDTPDTIKWSMEEPPAAADVPLAELPDELEDMVGELLDQEAAMTEEVEDVSSSWLDSIDKGAGWDAMDGPISSMSAKGVTGNRLPNEMEVGGRSGEGRTGRSHGQMVEQTADGKGGRETPTRVTPGPFEPGSIEDAATDDTGGATGGGKLSGFAQEGLRGPSPSPRRDTMPRLAGQQARIRQEAETLALKLRRYNLPTGDLEGSVETMKAFEQAARAGNGLAVKLAFSRIIDALHNARSAVRAETGLHRDASRLPEWARKEMLSGFREGVPRGYEDMAAEYFKVMAEQAAPEQGAE